MIRRFGLAFILLTALLFIYAEVQEIDEQMVSGEFHKIALQQKGIR